MSLFRAYCRRLPRPAVDFLLPPLCPACKSALREPPHPAHRGRGASRSSRKQAPQTRCGGSNDNILEMCGECLEAGGRAWRRGVSVFAYGGRVRQLIHRFKYHGEVCLAPFFADAMLRNWRRHGLEHVDAVVPVPLHWRRRLWRGYNQAELLAERVAHGLNVPMRHLLRRRNHTKQQALLDIDRRRDNVNNVFRAVLPANPPTASILVVDDVFTTGSTLLNAARTLAAAGVAEISVLTLARD